MASSSGRVDRRPGAAQRIVRRARRVDLAPFNPAKLIGLLLRDDFCVRVGGIARGCRRARAGWRDRRRETARESGRRTLRRSRRAARAPARANTASTKVECPAAMMRRALSSSDAWTLPSPRCCKPPPAAARFRPRRTTPCAQRRSADAPRRAPAESPAPARAPAPIFRCRTARRPRSAAAPAERSARRRDRNRLRARFRDCRRAWAIRLSSRAAVTFARIAARTDMNSGSAASASRSAARRVSAR